jgi:hypothetical protein
MKVPELVGDEAEGVVSLQGKLNKNSLAEGPFSGGGKGIRQLFGRGVDVFHNGNGCEEPISQMDQAVSQDVAGDDSDEIEEEEEEKGPHPRDDEILLKELDMDFGGERSQDPVQGVEDELQDQKRDSQRQNHQNSRENLGPEML